MSQFRLVILDYAKKQIQNPQAMRILNDLIAQKQKYFERTDPNYVVMDKHDMIGTHFLIYETSNLFDPQMIFAIRVTYEDRAKQFRLKTPLLDLVPQLDEGAIKAFETYRAKHPVLVDCNSWAVDPSFSHKKSGLNLSDIGYTMIYIHLMRSGLNHFVGCSNERYKASRWIEKSCDFTKEYIFTHPAVPDPHMLIMVDKFNHAHMQSVYFENQSLFMNLFESCPTDRTYLPFNITAQNLFENNSNQYQELQKAG